VKSDRVNIRNLWTKVVKRQSGGRSVQVVEKLEKINFKKCPKRPLQYDIMVL
jgi:hypothetical protein